MKKIFFLFFVIAAFLVAIPVFAKSTGPPGVTIASEPAVVNMVASMEKNIETAAVSNGSAVYQFTEAKTDSEYNYERTIAEFYPIATRITLAGLMSCAIVALVSYLMSTARKIYFDLRDRKEPMPMDQTAFA